MAMIRKAKELNEITKEMIDLNKTTIKAMLIDLEPLFIRRIQDIDGKRKKVCMYVLP